jgi:hypothetical protein
MTRKIPHIVAVLVALAVGLAVSSCSTAGVGNDALSGVITEVNGDLTSVAGFVVLAEDGSSHRFTPVNGLRFEGGPLTHLRDHVVSGQPVVVTFERGPDGELIAVHVEDE